jgi:aldehyde dehydrogenase (NAD+)
MTTIAVDTLRNYINGQWRDAQSGVLLEDRNPAQPDQVLARFQGSSSEDVRLAAEAAAAALPAWSALPGPKRGEILFKAAALLEARADEVAQAMTAEEGKTFKEARGETLRGASILRFFAGEGAQPTGDTFPSANPSTFLFTTRAPLGVVTVITPWNFPVAIPCWKIAPALVYGNTVVFKPAELTPLTAQKIVQVFEEAGLPAGVLNFVTGKGSQIGDALVTHERVNGVTFTGSNEVGRHVYHLAIDGHKKAQLELGGKNPIVVLDDADLDQAVTQTINGAFLSTGQKCTAASRAIVVRAIKDEFTRRLVERARTLKVGDGMDPQTFMGPLVSKSQLETVTGYIKIGQEEGARLLIGGHALEAAAYRGGYYVEPTIFDDVRAEMRIAQEEIFGPVLGLITVEDFDAALAVANNVRFGLSASVFTRDIARAFRFIGASQSGIVHVNSETAGAEPQVPFGGMKSSSSFSREQGKTAIEFFTQIKTVYFDMPPAR